MVAREEHADGTTISWREESWQQTSAPFVQRTVRVRDGMRVEVLTRDDGTVEIYDPAANTISRGVKQLPGEPKALPPAAKPGEGPPQKSVAAGVASKQAIQKEAASIRGNVLAILQAGKIGEAGRTTVNGRPPVRLASKDEAAVILVDPQTRCRSCGR
jgi:hypothetical protein